MTPNSSRQLRVLWIVRVRVCFICLVARFRRPPVGFWYGNLLADQIRRTLAEQRKHCVHYNYTWLGLRVGARTLRLGPNT